MKRIAVCMAALAAGLLLTACQGQEPTAGAAAVQEAAPGTEQAAHSRVLIAYFSLEQNAPWPEDMDASTSASVMRDGGERIGTTESMARLIGRMTGGDLYAIRTEAPYPADVRAVIDQNHQEMADGTLPALTGSLPDLTGYDTVFIGYPVWATKAPQAILTFLSQTDLSGKTVIPFCTHDGYGPGTSYDQIAAASGAEVKEGLDLDAGDVPGREAAVRQWLERIGEAAPAGAQGTAVTIAAGGQTLQGVLYDTPLAGEIRAHLPLTVRLAGYGTREFYGPLPFEPAQEAEGQLTFEEGDITYCRTNNTIAIFYSKEEMPDLTMEVVPIGRLTSDPSALRAWPGQVDAAFSL